MGERLSDNRVAELAVWEPGAKVGTPNSCTRDEWKALAREVLELREAVKWLTCDNVHHPKADRHGIGEPCPVLARFRSPEEGP